MTDDLARELLAEMRALREKLARPRPFVQHLQLQPLGCVCPLGAESACHSMNCPRRCYVGTTIGGNFAGLPEHHQARS